MSGDISQVRFVYLKRDEEHRLQPACRKAILQANWLLALDCLTDIIAEAEGLIDEIRRRESQRDCR